MSMHTMERRMAALEARLADVEGGYGETIYQLRRESVENKLGIAKILDHLGLDPVTPDEVEEYIDGS